MNLIIIYIFYLLFGFSQIWDFNYNLSCYLIEINSYFLLKYFYYQVMKIHCIYIIYLNINEINLNEITCISMIHCLSKNKFIFFNLHKLIIEFI